MSTLPKMLDYHRIAAGPHGFRSSFRDWAAERTDHPREVIEAALAHLVQNKVEAAYARSGLFERRRRLMAVADGVVAGLAFPSTIRPRRFPEPPDCELLTRGTVNVGLSHRPAAADRLANFSISGADRAAVSGRGKLNRRWHATNRPGTEESPVVIAARRTASIYMRQACGCPPGRHRQHPRGCQRVARAVAKDPAGASRPTGPPTHIRPSARRASRSRRAHERNPWRGGGTDHNESVPSGGQGKRRGWAHPRLGVLHPVARRRAPDAGLGHAPALPGHHPTHARRLMRLDGFAARRERAAGRRHAGRPVGPITGGDDDLDRHARSPAPAMVAAAAQAPRQPRAHAPRPRGAQAVLRRSRPAHRGRHQRPDGPRRAPALYPPPARSVAGCSTTRSTTSSSPSPRSWKTTPRRARATTTPAITFPLSSRPSTTSPTSAIPAFVGDDSRARRPRTCPVARHCARLAQCNIPTSR